MNPYGITFNGIHSSTYGLDLIASRRPIMPEKKDSYIDIPHKDGSVLIADSSARDIVIEVDFKLRKRSARELFNTCRQIGGIWLTTNERKQLIFDDDPDYYYMAKVSANIELEKMVAIGKFTVEFRCLPYPELI
jgi:predicted phage tail component-like protein